VRYQEAVSRWGAQQVRAANAPTLVADLPHTADTTVVELLIAYLEHAKTWYTKNGEPTGSLAAVRPVLRLLREMFGSVPVSKFKPSHLDAFQRRMIANGASRNYINGCCTKIKTMFKWGVAKDLVPVATWQGLLAVRGLAKGRTKARETDPVLPVDDWVVDGTLPHLPVLVADMVRFQRLTGARPGEVCAIRPCDVDRSGDVWLYRPESHKTEHHGRSRTIAIGPRAQEILRPYLLRGGDAYCFSPAESERQRNESRREARETPITPSQEARKPARKPRRPKGTRYKKDAYRRTVARAVELANVTRKEAGADPLPHWHPNQLRHSLGTEVRQRFGLEAAQVVLGHSKADVTQVYAERDQRLAVEVARQVG
jgi:integrase